MRDKNIEMAETIAERVAECGGRVYYVGGLVRDRILKIENKDIDIEVHGISKEQLEAILDACGDCTKTGADYGVFGLKEYELDIALPRVEKATGHGHKDFEVCVAPLIGSTESGKRRDFTMNALLQDVLTLEIIDPFGGIADMEAGIVRHINDQKYGEDPLRVLRSAQFCARFGFSLADETVALSKKIDLSVLSGERVFGELEKALQKAERPSLFFEEMRRMGQLSCWFPEVEALIGIEQDPTFHPEGDVWNHTMLVLDVAAGLREKAEYPLGLMLSALCHDFGKVDCMQHMDGRIRALGHEEAGVLRAKHFLGRMTRKVKLHKYVENMVLLHMKPNILAMQKAGMKAMAKLFDTAVSPADLLLLAKADCGGQAREFDYSETEHFLREKLGLFEERMAMPYVTGADLVKYGMKQGPEIGEAIAYAHKLRLAGVEKEIALKQTLGYMGYNPKKK